MKANVTPEGVNVPKSLLDGVDTVEIRREGGHILIIPLNGAPIMNLNELKKDAQDSANLQALLDSDVLDGSKLSSTKALTSHTSTVADITKATEAQK